MEYSANGESEEEQETVASADWIQNSKKPVTCPFGKKEPDVAKMASHAIFQYIVLAIDDTHNIRLIYVLR